MALLVLVFSIKLFTRARQCIFKTCARQAFFQNAAFILLPRQPHKHKIVQTFPFDKHFNAQEVLCVPGYVRKQHSSLRLRF